MEEGTCEGCVSKQRAVQEISGCYCGRGLEIVPNHLQMKTQGSGRGKLDWHEQVTRGLVVMLIIIMLDIY